MIWIDYAILGLIVISLVIGLIRGFTKEIFSLAVWIIAVMIGLNFSREFSFFLEKWINVPAIRMAASFASLFCATILLGSIVGLLLGELFKNNGLSVSDRFAGLIFGVIRGVIVVAVCIMLAGLTPIPNEPWWKESMLIPPFQTLAIWLKDHFPTSVAGFINYR